MSSQNKYTRLLFFILFAFTLSLNNTLSANANLLGNFKVSKKAVKIAQRRSLGSGSRSQEQCNQNIPSKSVELLVPDINVAHHTLSKRPTLYIFSHNKHPIESQFTLVNPNNPKIIFKKNISVHQGITKVKLPPKVELKDENIYLWNIAVFCARDHPRVLTAGIQKIPSSSNLTSQIRQAKSDFDKIRIYVQNGIWYESLDLAVQSSQSNFHAPFAQLLIMAGIR